MTLLCLRDVPGAIQELNLLTQNTTQQSSIDYKIIQNTIFYKAIQNVTELDLSTAFGFQSAYPIDTLLLIVRIIAQSKSLQKLNISGNNIAEHAPKFAMELMQSESLCVLDISNNNMGEYAPEFAMEFAESESLHSLNISYNNIGQSAIELADSLSLLLSLHTLDVSSNAIGVHATKFARELAQSESIRVLDIFNNNIGPEALNFAASLPPLLYSLDVSRNNIDNDICKFIKALPIPLHTLKLAHIQHMHAMSDKKLNELSLTQEMMTIRVQKYTDLANKLKNMEAIAQLEHKSTYTDISNKISITDLMFLNICHKGKIQELLGDQDKYLITKYSNIKFLNILELMGVCHIPAKADEVQHSLLLDLPTEVVVVILCYLTLADMHKIAGQHYLSNGKAPLIDVDMTFAFEEIHSEDGITTPLSGEVSAG